ncbi:hypothetical protein ACJQWK_04428 [Exserohilum turcicum]
MQGEKDVEAKQNSTNQSLGFKSMHARGRISWADEPDSESVGNGLPYRLPDWFTEEDLPKRFNGVTVWWLRSTSQNLFVT